MSKQTLEELKQQKSARDKRYYENNKEKLLLKQKQYYESNRSSILEYQKQYYEDNREDIIAYQKFYHDVNKATIALTSKKWYEDNKPKVTAYRRKYRAERKETDPAFAIQQTLRVRLNHAIRAQGAEKLFTTCKLVGCSFRCLKEHLESQFKDGMTWNNRGEWHIDHIRPCASFNLLDPEQQLQCFHYTNLQPLWRFENQTKGAKWGDINYHYKQPREIQSI